MTDSKVFRECRARPPISRAGSDEASTVQTFEPKRVLLWIESSRAYGRGCLLGIAEYCRTHDPWRLIHFEHDLEQAFPSFLGEMKFDGIIARSENKDIARALESIGAPVVDLRGAVQPADGYMIDTDPTACAELAFEHFWERGLRSMAFCGYRGVDWSDRRHKAFIEFAAQRGIEPVVYQSDALHNQRGTIWNEARGELEDPDLGAWLDALSKPVAILAANDVRGRQVLAACSARGIAVPEQVAVLGVDNDEVVCELSYPPLSSIEPDTAALGYAGAKALDRLMNGKRDHKPIAAVRLIRPSGVMTRLSTDVAAIDDLAVGKAVSIIRERSGNLSNVDDLASAVGVSRATLERRFRSALGRSPRQEIDRVRLDRARTLVRRTTYPLHRIAEMVGYSNSSRLLDAYRRRFGVTPGSDRDASDPPERDIEP